MQRLMPIQALLQQLVQLGFDWELITHCDLVLYGDVNGGMNHIVRKLDSSAPVVVKNQVDPFQLWQSQPFLRVRRMMRIVLHEQGMAYGTKVRAVTLCSLTALSSAVRQRYYRLKTAPW